MWTQEGIVMASDSRLTLNTVTQQGNQQVQTSFPQSDANYKTFLAPNNIGISTFGAAAIEGVPISGYIESFIQERLSQDRRNPHQVATLLLDYFRSLTNVPDTGFHVAGYNHENGQQVPEIWRIIVIRNEIVQINQASQTGGVAWDGEGDIIARLLHQVTITHGDGTTSILPNYPVQWIFFTLQDAIDYAIYAVKITRDTMRFQSRIKTVGGPVDVLVIKPGQESNRAIWIQRKELHADGNPLSF